MNKTDGFLYCAYSSDGTVDKFFEKQFLVSLNSLKSVLPECSVTLYTNISLENKYQIDNIIYDSSISQTHIIKAHGLLKSPYDKTIFLDMDTVIHRHIIKDIFLVLDEFDFTCCYGNRWNQGQIYPDLNSGLIGVKNNLFTQREIEWWIKEFESKNDEDAWSDQRSFREVFMRNKTKFHILPWWFQHRHQHFNNYFSNVVLTHGHSMCKDKVTKEIIKKLENENIDIDNHEVGE